MQIYDEKKTCCGCAACFNVCPVGAIRMEEDEEGFLYPVIDMKKCIKCNRCKDVCAWLNDVEKNVEEQFYYAARSTDPEVVEKSSSGGVFYEVAGHVIGQGGVVYGVRFNEQLEAVHDRATTLQEVVTFMGSKYVQSNVGSTYAAVGKDLKDGLNVLFSGTPCQNAALYNYLSKKKIDAEKLVSIDIVCHGVNSPKLLREYIRCAEKMEDTEIALISMRDKKLGWGAQKASFWNVKNERMAISDKYPYNKLYLSLLAVRESCFHCQFTNMNRMGDITLADFWNVPKDSFMNDDKGVSTIILNTGKGITLFDSIKEKLVFEEYTAEQIWQPHLEFPAAMPKKRTRFWQEYREKGGEYVIGKYSKGTFLSKVIKFGTPILKKLGLYQFGANMYAKVFGKK